MKPQLENCESLCKIPKRKYNQASRMSSDVLNLLRKIEDDWERPLDNSEGSMWSEDDTKKLENDLRRHSFRLSLTASQFAEDHSECMGKCQRKRWEEIQKIYGNK